jgi:16S rRNA (guanine966-N2)-methyltransferase
LTRVIAGAAKGRRLAVPPRGTRPTSDRAREGLFNTLATLLDLAGARVLDLFAGSGAVGLEALSRGAATAVLVESGHGAAAVARRNAETVGLPGASVVVRTVGAYLAGQPEPFDLVFADPPYAQSLDDVLASLTRGWLAPGALVVVERSARDGDLAWPGGIETLFTRRYGETALWYGRPR